jgi:hypothetical protein
MEIHLEHMDAETWLRPEGWTVVGRVGRLALAYDAERRPHLVGEGEPRPLDPAEVNRAMVPAIDAAASKLWPGGWHQAFSEVFGVNRRSLNVDRLLQRGLPPGVLQALAELSDSHDAEGLGWLVMALGRYVDRFTEGGAMPPRVEEALAAARNAGDALLRARKGKPILPE